MRWTGFVAALAGCQGPAEIGEPPAAAVTWDDVAPIIEARCTSCHQAGGIGSFALSTYEDAKPWAAGLASAAESRIMPPWLVADDGTCNDFRDSHWLAQAEIDTLVAWSEAGAPAGTREEPLVPDAPATLDRRDKTLDAPLQIPEAEGDLFAPNDEYRCFLFENVTDADVFLTGYEVVPGNAEIVHHVLGMVVDPDAETWDGSGTNRDAIATMEAEDERAGWDCLGTVGGVAREEGIPVSWAPGQGAVEYPGGLGVRLEPADYFVVQIHYNLVDPANVGSSDQTTLHLKVEDTVEHEAYIGLPDLFLASIYNFPTVDTLPAGEPAYDYTWTMSGEDVLYWSYVPWPQVVSTDEFRIWGVMPHMHQRGLAQEMAIERAGGEEVCGYDVPRWDFEWQLIYFYEEPITMSADDTMRVTCTYDTTDMTTPVWPGWGTDNEMCLAGVVITLD